MPPVQAVLTIVQIIPASVPPSTGIPPPSGGGPASTPGRGIRGTVPCHRGRSEGATAKSSHAPAPGSQVAVVPQSTPRHVSQSTRCTIRCSPRMNEVRIRAHATGIPALLPVATISIGPRLSPEG
jgi:hypothetical protein